MNRKCLVMNINLSDELWRLIQRSSPSITLTFHFCLKGISGSVPLVMFYSSCFPQIFWLNLRAVDGTFSFIQSIAKALSWWVDMYFWEWHVCFSPVLRAVEEVRTYFLIIVLPIFLFNSPQYNTMTSIEVQLWLWNIVLKYHLIVKMCSTFVYL